MNQKSDNGGLREHRISELGEKLLFRPKAFYFEKEVEDEGRRYIM